jgi:eukaryotic-like serine/threonine-protein kinase
MEKETIGHYRILRLLGAGGMGRVYLAEDLKLGREVALKVLPEEFASDESRMRRFVREAKAASALSHPNVAQIYEVGEDNGTSFITMEFVEGESLADKLVSGPLDAETTLDIALQLADALDEVHAHGISHRDLKPSNVIISRRGHVKLVDFGLARFDTGASDADTKSPTASLTTPGLIVGSVPYMSPEQALGRKSDHRSDIFSLGVLLYELTTGQRPFRGETDTEIIDNIVHGAPVAVARLNYKVSPELERIIRKCLEKNPEDRYQSARELLVDLRNLRRDSSGARTPHALRKLPRRALIISGTAVCVLVIAVVVGIRRPARTAPVAGTQVVSVAVLPFVNTTSDPQTEYLSDGISETLINSLSQLPQIRVIARTTSFRFRGRELNPQSIGRELKVGALLTGKITQLGKTLVVQADLIDTRDGTELWGDRYSRNFSDIFAIQDDIAAEISRNLRRRFSPQEVAKGQTRDPEAYQLYLKGRFELAKRAAASYWRAIDLFEQAIRRDPNYALAYVSLAEAYGLLEVWAGVKPGDAYPKARTAALKALELDDTLGEAHAALGLVYHQYDFNWDAAEREYRRAIALNPSYAPTHLRISTLLLSTGRGEEALREIRVAMQVDPLNFVVVGTEGWLLHTLRRPDEAIRSLQKALELEDHFFIRQTLGESYELKGDYAQAIANLEIAVEKSHRAARTVGALAHAYARAGRRADAMKLIDEMKHEAAQNPVVAYHIALGYAGLGDANQTIEWLECAYDARSRWLIYTNVEPRFDLLAHDSRFHELLRHLGLRQYPAARALGATSKPSHA